MSRRDRRPAKLTPPQVRGVVARSRLFARLDDASATRLAWVSGPAGAGKTTLVASWLAASGRKALWYQVDDGDADPATFFAYLARGVQLAVPRRSIRLPALTPEHLPALATFARNFARRAFEALPAGTVLVLDNFQELPEEAALNDLVGTLAAEAPDQCVIVVVSRAGPSPGLVRLAAHGEVGQVDWDALRLTTDEAQAIAQIRSAGHVDRSVVERLRSQSEGWAAGFVLSLDVDAPPARRALSTATAQGRENVFDYFAREVLDRAGPEVRDFLLASAALDAMTAEVATALTGVLHAGRILADLARRSYFTTVHPGEPASYQYHALFLGFLRRTAEREFGAPAWAETRRRALAVLEQQGDWEACATLSVDLADWTRLETSLGAVGGPMLAQGRNRAVLAWLSRVPEQEIARRAWLRLWRSAANTPFDPPAALADGEAAWQAFAAVDDCLGMFLAVCGITDGLFLIRDFRPLSRWVGELDRLRGAFPGPLPPQVDLRVCAAALHGYLLSNPAHPETEAWHLRGLAIVAEASAHPQARLYIGAIMLLRRTFHGSGKERAAWLVATLDPVAALPDVPPLNRIMWWAFSSTYLLWYGGRDGPAGSRERSDRAFEIAREHGVHALDLLLRCGEAYMNLAEGAYAQAHAHLQSARQIQAALRPYEECQLAFIEAGVERACGRLGRALAAARRALATGADSAIPTGIAYPAICMGLVLQSRGERVGALRHSAIARRAARHCDYVALECMSWFVSTLVALDRGNERRAVALARRGFSIAAREQFMRLPGFSPVDFSSLVALAARHGIEPDYTRSLVRERRLQPPAGAVAWPWAVEIQCLGRFEVRVGGEPLQFGRKTPRKPLELLKLLVANRPEGVVERTVLEALWPREDADAARHAYATTLHRLRRLIGDEVVETSEGRTRLDRDRVWADAWVVDAAFGNPATAADTELEPAFRAYEGDLFEEERDLPWVRSARERLKGRFRRAAVELGRRREIAGRHRDALDVFLRALDVDDLAEDFYQGALRAYRALGLDAEAVLLYRQCESVLGARLGVAPSALTRALVPALLGD